MAHHCDASVLGRILDDGARSAIDPGVDPRICFELGDLLVRKTSCPGFRVPFPGSRSQYFVEILGDFGGGFGGALRFYF